MHRLKGHPIIPFAHDSSFGCALCDPVIAVWCLGGGRSPWARRRGTDEFRGAGRSSLRNRSAIVKE
ncbi:DUF6010 family protein [Streptomyces sp. NBC_00557]|uniref:DUF6010 family protein n=1 Tax=Streptomyces sp. NBC_00557 TaxID=2975776 RepID=UPI003FCCC5B0